MQQVVKIEFSKNLQLFCTEKKLANILLDNRHDNPISVTDKVQRFIDYYYNSDDDYIPIED